MRIMRPLEICAQVEMWEAVTRAVAALEPDRAAGMQQEGGTGAAQAAQMDPEQLVQYEGMLVAASAAQRRRCVNFNDVQEHRGGGRSPFHSGLVPLWAFRYWPVVLCCW